MKLSIDVGTEQRTLVAGIAEAYEPEALVGRTVVIVFNLKPAKLMGIESNGMVLAASPDGGKPTLVGFDADVPPGHAGSLSQDDRLPLPPRRRGVRSRPRRGGRARARGRASPAPCASSRPATRPKSARAAAVRQRVAGGAVRDRHPSASGAATFAGRPGCRR